MMRLMVLLSISLFGVCACAEEAYTFLWWSDGWRGRAAEWREVLHVQTNRYGAAFDVRAPGLLHLGVIAEPLAYERAVGQSNDVVTGLPAAGLRLSVVAGGVRYDCAGAASGQDDEANFPVRIIESGRFLQRFDVLHGVFQSADGKTLDAEGRIEVIAWPERLHIVSEIVAAKDLGEVTLSIVLESGGETWTETRRVENVLAGATESVSVAWPPDALAEAGGPADIAVRDGEDGEALPVTGDPMRGWCYVDLPECQWDIAAEPDRLDRFPVRIANAGAAKKTYNLLFAFDGGAFQGITGLCPMLRDAQGAPSGIPVQISKNWHRHKDRRFLYDGPWLHAAARIAVEPGETWEGEFAIAYARWGGVPSASHAQLCLIGWGVNQLWDQAAIGSWGESITYDPDVNLNRAMIDDVRPLMVTGMGGGRWSWTSNVGGGDFLVYFDADGKRQFLTRMRTAYLSQGPNLTDVIYSGVSADGKIAARIEVSTPRCDDVNRAYHRIRYDVLAPALFSRMAFYQLGADHYNDHQFATIACGDADGLAEEWQTDRGGKKYLRAGIECMGQAPWFSLHGAERNRHHPDGAWANRGLVVRSWKARLGGQDVMRPFVAIYGTSDGIPSANVELVPPPDLKELMPGDYVEAEVELLIVPMAADDYYGPNQALRDDLAANGNTWQPIHRLARENALDVRMEEGMLQRAYPTVIATIGDKAVFDVQGGAGYVPITFTGLRQRAGYVLTCDGVAVDQHCHGNDYWQTAFDDATGTWSHTYNVCLDAPIEKNRVHRISFSPQE